MFDSASQGNSTEDFNAPQFLKDLLGIEPIAAYPVGIWTEYIEQILSELGLEQYDILGSAYSSQPFRLRSKEKNSLRNLLDVIRLSETFEELESAVEQYEREAFCVYNSAKSCTKCGNKPSLWKSISPLCGGVNVADSVDTADMYAFDAVGLEFQPGEIGDFSYHSLILDTPVVYWAMKTSHPVTETLLSSLLKQAERNGVDQIYLLVDQRTTKIPTTLPDHISYNVLRYDKSSFPV